MKRAALYVRVSTEEQKKHGLSVNSQIAALRQYCQENGCTEVGLYNDAGVSARKSYRKRAELLRLMEDCRQKKIDVILFTKLDRWFRSVGDYYEVQKILDGCHVPWRAIWEDYETETSSGIFKVNIMLSVAQSEADRTSERIKAVNEYRRERGDYIGQAPIGYMRRNNRLVVREDQREGVSAFFTAYLNYQPIKDAVLAAKEHGVQIRRNTAYLMLKSRTYAGDAFGSMCEPYISEDEYQKIQNRLSDFVRAPRTARKYLFQGICRCGYCGGKMAASGRQRHSEVRGDYLQKVYQCRNVVGNYQTDPCPGCGINEDVLEQILLSQLDAALSDYNVKATAFRESPDRKKYEKKKQDLETKLDRVAELYEDGLIDRAQYKEKKEKIQLEMSAIQEPTEIHAIAPLPSGWQQQYAELSEDGRREFWHRIIKSVIVKKNREVQIEF